MKIHTTQNLSSLAKKNSTDNIASEKELRNLRMQNMHAFYHSKDESMDSMSFKAGKKPNSKDIKKVVESAKKIVGEIEKTAKPEVEKGDNILLSSFFNKLLKVAEYETVVQAAIAAVICVLLRPITILALPTKKSKVSEDKPKAVEAKADANVVKNTEPNAQVAFRGGKKKAQNSDKTNNIYASAHSIASGIVGLVTVFLLTTPFKKGADYVMNKMLKELKPETLKRLWPHLDLKSIVNNSGERIDPFVEKVVDGKKVKEVLWKNVDGRKFEKEIKNCAMLPEFRKLAEVSDDTFQKLLKLDIDWASQKGKSFNEVVTRDGKKLYDVIDFKTLGLKVSHVEKSAKDGKVITTKGQILFKDIDKDYLKELVESADENSFLRKLDVDSVFDGNKVRDFRQWKEVGTGNQWKLDLDSVHICSELETANYRPRTSGRLRFDEKEGIHKFRTYQNNGEAGMLGTEITDEMLRAEKSNEALIKALTWLPDLSFRVPIAVSTIAMIPWILKSVFGIEKKKPVKPAENLNTDLNKNITNEVKNKKVAFKAAAPVPKKGIFSKMVDYISEKMAKLYGKPLIESKKMAGVSEWLGNWSDKVTQHMTTLGSLITSSVYVQRTLSNKDMDSDRKKTLAINQALCFVVPTAAAYYVDSKLNNWVKNKGYRFTGLQKRLIAQAKAEGKDVSKMKEVLGTKIKGVRILASLATFTLIYRYLTPVLVTPVANKLGDWWNAKSSKKKQAEANSKIAA